MRHEWLRIVCIYIYTYSFCIGCIPSVVIGVHGHLGFHSSTFVMLILNSELIILYFIKNRENENSFNFSIIKVRVFSYSIVNIPVDVNEKY